jgi:hypothetical protein
MRPAFAVARWLRRMKATLPAQQSKISRMRPAQNSQPNSAYFQFFSRIGDPYYAARALKEGSSLLQ